jgi:hypothetical protein
LTYRQFERAEPAWWLVSDHAGAGNELGIEIV